jgi:uncharacterized protein (DUF305 family)
VSRLAPLVVAILLAGCGGGGDGGGVFTASGGPGSDPKPADAEFARTMVENDQKLGALVELARKRAMRRELRKIAKSMLARQRGELVAFQESAAELAASGVRAAGRNAVPPTVDPRALRRAVSFDHEFMVQAIAAHEHALAAAEVELDRGGDPKLKRLARQVFDTRSRDLDQLRRWLHTWYGEGTYPGDDGGGGGSGEEPRDPDGYDPDGGGEPEV